MLSLANTVSSSGVAHEQLYSLLLDGDSDYLQLPSSFSNPKISISAWIYNTTETGTKCIFSNRNASVGATRGILFYVSSKTLRVKCQDVTLEATTGGAYNNWIHACMTFDPSAASNQLKLYENGSLASQNTCTIAHDDTVWGTAKIGQANTTDYYFSGNIDDVAIWDEALDADAVAAVYNSGKPFNLNNNRGNYDNSSDLLAYYKMFNGPFDDLQNGVVHDAHNPGFGADVIDNGGFDDGSDWSITNNTGTASEITGGYLRIETDGANTDVTQTSKTVANGVYKLDYIVLESDGGDLGLVTQGNITSSIPSSVGTHTYYFTAHSTSFILKRRAGALDVKLDNVQLRRLNGYPGLTSGTATFSANTPDD
mgnify:CR=1 FL=1|jgi:hypothetical protein|tara:strand:- start:6173 stop:7276 length:1104 start_codon:yes stop_codon:yes gene_type:complete